MEPAEVAHLIAEAFSGPYPPPDMLRAYEEVCPGMAKQLLEDTREVSRHKIAMERLERESRRESMRRDYSEGRWGQVCGVVVCGIMVAGAVLLGQAHAEWAGSILGAGTAGTIVTAFIYGRRYSKKESNAKTEAEPPTGEASHESQRPSG